MQNVSQSQFRRLPYKSVLIEDLLESVWLEQDKRLSSRYGQLYRVKIIGMVLKKKEIVNENIDDSFLMNDNSSNSRVSFLIDDGTGLIWVTHWGIEPEKYEHIKIGSIVELIGYVRSYMNKPQVNIEIIFPTRDPNFITYHILRVLYRRKIEPRQEIIPSDNGTEFDMVFPDDSIVINQNNNNSISTYNDNYQNSNSNSIQAITDQEFANLRKEISEDFGDLEDYQEITETQDILDIDETEEILNQQLNHEQQNQIIDFNQDIDNEFKEEENSSLIDNVVNDTNDLTEKVFLYIKKHANNDGVAVKNISENLNLSAEELKPILKQLQEDLKIFRVSPGYYAIY